MSHEVRVVYEMTVVYDPEDDGTAYWVAWTVEDNGSSRHPTKFRVFRDERNKTKGIPITDAMSRDEAYAYLRKLKLLLGANNDRGTETS